MSASKKQSMCKRGHALNKENRNKYGKCKQCAVLRVQKWRLVNRDKVVAWELANNQRTRERTWASFGIKNMTLERYQQMLEAANHVCEVCKQPDHTGRALAVDHDHATGEVRGLLCGNCNRACGLVQDSSLRLRQLADYLDQAA